MHRFSPDARYTILGLIEGIVISLGLGARTIVGQGDPAEISHVVINAGLFAALTNLVTSFFTEQFDARRNLLNVERMLVVARPERVFATDLYRAAWRRALLSSLTYAVASFAGAAIPMLPLVLVPQARATGLVVPMLTLGVLGFVLGRRSASVGLLWALGLVAAGGLVTVVGVRFPV